MIQALDPDLRSDFQPFGDYGSGFGSSKKWKPITSTGDVPDMHHLDEVAAAFLPFVHFTPPSFYNSPLPRWSPSISLALAGQEGFYEME